MDYLSYRASAPGSLMLFGEHAVLRNKQAIITAINHYIRVNLVPRSDHKIKLISSKFASQLIFLDKFKVSKPYDYVLTAIKSYLPKIKTGFTLKIDADFPTDIGFGSSAAVTVATLGVLHLWLQQQPIGLDQLYRQAVKVIRLVQGFGSGADVAASIFGGVISYRMRPVLIKKLEVELPLVVIYSGKKTLTSQVVAAVATRRQKLPKVFTRLDEAIDSCTKEALLAIKHQDWSRLGELMNIHQGLQDALGVNDSILAELIFSLRGHATIHGAKISGSGLGDCVVALGRIKANVFPENITQRKNGVREIRVRVSGSGWIASH